VWAGWYQGIAGRLISAIGHEQAVLAMAFSPDGTRLATASEDKTAQLWDTRTWEPVGRPMRHDHPVEIVTFSPDGKLLATVAGSRVRLWDTTTGDPHGRPMVHGDLQRGAGTTSVAFSPGGKLLASGCLDGSARLWDTATGGPQGPPLQPDGSPARSGFAALVGFGPPPESPLVVLTGGSVSVWNPATGQARGWLQRRQPPSPHNLALASSGDGAVRAIASDRTVWLWDAAQHRFRSDLIREPGRVGGLAISPDANLLATASAEGPGVQLWTTCTGERAGSPLLLPSPADSLIFGPPHSGLLITRSRRTVQFWSALAAKPYPLPPPAQDRATALALSPDGRTLAAAAANGTVYLWAIPSPSTCRHLLAPPGPLSIAPIDGSAELATYSWDGLRIWSAETGQLLSRPAGVPGRMNGAFSEDGRFLVEWGGSRVTVRETETGRLRGRPLHLARPASYAALSHRGAVLATLARSGTVQLWDAASQRPRGGPLRHPTAEGILEFSPDERLLATANGDDIYLWETATGGLQVPSIHLVGAPRWVAFSPDSRTLAVVSQGSAAVTLWNAATGQHSLALPQPAPPERGAFSPDGGLLAIVTNDNTVRLWNTQSGRLFGKPMPHRSQVLAMRFSPDGKRLMTASLSGARLWDVTTGQLAARPLLTTEPFWEARFGPDGRAVVFRAGRPEGRPYLWRTPAAPAGLAAIERGTTTALGVAPDPGGSAELLRWRDWRRRRREAPSPDPGIDGAPTGARHALRSSRTPQSSALASRRGRRRNISLAAG
jgi:WD40 repeat protein